MNASRAVAAWCQAVNVSVDSFALPTAELSTGDSREEVDLSVVGQGFVPAVLIDRAVYRHGDSILDKGLGAGVLLFEFAHQLTDGACIEVDRMPTADGGAQFAPDGNRNHLLSNAG